MVPPEKDYDGHGRQGALAALREVATDPEIVKQFGIPAAAFQDEDYQQLIALAGGTSLTMTVANSSASCATCRHMSLSAYSTCWSYRNEHAI